MKMFKTIYNHDNPVSPHGAKVSLTDQQYKDECNIDYILKSFRADGRVPNMKPASVGGDFSDVGDFSRCLERINRAKDEFASLPSDIRDRFGNDPSAYVDFVLDPANTEECIRLGLKVKPEVPKRTSEEILESIDQKIVTPKGETVA